MNHLNSTLTKKLDDFYCAIFRDEVEAGFRSIHDGNPQNIISTLGGDEYRLGYAGFRNGDFILSVRY